MRVSLLITSNNTLRYNLTIENRDVTAAELYRVCETARVDEFFDDLPKGYDTMLGDDGVRLSGGQKQRVALARALLEDADLFILDKSTSDLDSNLEQEVQTAIEAMDRDYAMITIAHRLSTVQNADRIYTMDDGEVTKTGTHTELLDNGAIRRVVHDSAERVAIQAKANCCSQSELGSELNRCRSSQTCSDSSMPYPSKISSQET